MPGPQAGAAAEPFTELTLARLEALSPPRDVDRSHVAQNFPLKVMTCHAHRRSSVPRPTSLHPMVPQTLLYVATCGCTSSP